MWGLNHRDYSFILPRLGKPIALLSNHAVLNELKQEVLHGFRPK